jgi:hypothetical protein
VVGRRESREVRKTSDASLDPENELARQLVSRINTEAEIRLRGVNRCDKNQSRQTVSHLSPYGGPAKIRGSLLSGGLL